MFERLTFIETPHDHEPVDDRCISTNRESARRCGKWHHIEIDIRRKSTIEAEFGPARGLAPS